MRSLNGKQIAKPVYRMQNHYIDFDFNAVLSINKVHSGRGVMLLMCLHFEQTTVSF